MKQNMFFAILSSTGAANRLLTKIQPKALGALKVGEKDAERRPHKKTKTHNKLKNRL